MTRIDVSRRAVLRGAGALAAAASVARLGRAADHTPPPYAPTAGLRFGLTAPSAAPYTATVDLAKTADALGFDTFFVSDHFASAFAGPPPAAHALEAWTMLSALAVQTRRIRLGVLVSGNTHRPPSVLAKMAVTVDHVSNGRLILGMGAAWHEREHRAFGIPFFDAGERAHRLVEAVEVVTRLLGSDRSSYHGAYYSLDDAPSYPRPVQSPYPPLLIGGQGPKVIQPLAARHARIWHFFEPGASDERVKALCEGFDRVCQDVGRDRAEIETATSLSPTLMADPASLRQQLTMLSGLGVGHVVFLPIPVPRAHLERFTHEVLPEFRAAAAPA